MPIKIKNLLLFAVGAIAITSAVAATTGKEERPKPREVVAVVPKLFPPQYSTDEMGKPAGFAIDVIEEIAQLANLKVTYLVKDTWIEVTRALRNGEANFIPNLGISDVRKNYASFTTPIETFPISLFVRMSAQDINGLSDLVGHKVGVVKTNVSVRLLRSRKDFDTLVFGSFEEALFALLSSQIDAIAYPEHVAWKLAEQARLADLIKIAGEPLKEVKRAVAVRKDDPELLSSLDKALREFLASPRYREIYSKWHAQAPPFWNVSRMLWLIGSPLILLTIILAVWRYYSVVTLNSHLRKANSKLAQAEKTLRENEIRLETTLNSITEGIVTIDESGIVRSFSLAAERMFGYTAKEAIGRNVNSLMPEPKRSQHGGYITRYLETGESRLIGRTREVMGQRKDGTIIPLEIGVAEIKFSDQRLFVGTLHDITGRRLAEAQLIQASKLAALGEMATGVAHELNQPLNVIKMAADSSIERIEDGAFDTEYARGKFERISAQVDRAAAIIGHMRVFGRRTDEKTEEIDLREAISGALGLVEAQLRLRNIEVKTTLAERCRKVLGHPVQLEQVVLNLISNAGDAIEANRPSPQAPGKITLIVEDTGPEERIRLIVRDTGGGIPDDVLPRIFEPFFTTKEVGKGTGLGLSVNYGIITEMGGVIEAANGADGAEITIMLPAADAGADPAGAEAG